MKYLLSLSLLLSGMAQALTFPPAFSLEVGRRVDLRPLADAADVTFTSSRPDIVTIENGVAVAKRLTPGDEVIKITARSGAQTAEAQVRTHGIEHAVGVGPLIRKDGSIQNIRLIIVRARDDRGRAPASLDMALATGNAAPGAFQKVGGNHVGNMNIVVTHLGSGQESQRLLVRMGQVEREIQLTPDPSPVSQSNPVRTLKGTFDDRVLTVQGTFQGERSIEARVRRNGSVMQYGWANGNSLPAVISLRGIPAGAAEIELRVFDAPVLDPRKVLPERLNFVQSHFMDTTFR